MHIINDTQLDYSDVLIAPQVTSLNHRADVDVVRTFKNIDLKGCPVMSSNMTQMGVFDVAKELVKHNMFACLHKFYTAKQIIAFFAEYSSCNNYFVTVGLRNKAEELEKLKKISNHKFSILLDVPNAYIPNVEAFVKELRYCFPSRIIAVGNVCTGDRTQELIKAGANIIKVGIGPSQVCRTRHVTGCGRPQLSAVIECANAAHQVGGYIIADGGFNMTGDLCKAFVAGADICMSGSMFAGCEEAAGKVVVKWYKESEVVPSQIIEKSTGNIITLDEMDGNNSDNYICETYYHQPKKKLFKNYYGMSSFSAQQENYGQKTTSGTSEGVESKLIPYTGPIVDTIHHIKGALRSCGTYIGAKNIKNFSRQGTFYKVNRTQ